VRRHFVQEQVGEKKRSEVVDNRNQVVSTRCFTRGTNYNSCL